MKYIDKKKNDPRWKDLHTHRKWTSSAAILSWGWSRVVSSIRRCPRCPSTTCCSSSCREKVDACPNGDSKRHRTDQHGSQPRAFHLRRGRSCPTRSAGDLVILFAVFAPMTTHSNSFPRAASSSVKSISPFDAKSKWWRISGSIHRSPFDGPPMAGLEEKNGRGRPQPDL